MIRDKSDDISWLSAALALRGQGFSPAQIMEIAGSPDGLQALKATCKWFPILRECGLSSTALSAQIAGGVDGAASLEKVAAEFQRTGAVGSASANDEDEKALREALACFRHLPEPADYIHEWFSRRWDPDNDGSNEIAYLLPQVKSFETNLARQLFHDDAARHTITAALHHLREVLIKLNPGVARDTIESAFFSDNVKYANIGVGATMLDEFLAAEDTNLRMRVVAFLNASYRWEHPYDLCQSLSRILFDPKNPDWKTRIADAGLDVERLAVARERLLCTGEIHPGTGSRVYFHPESHGAVAELYAARKGRKLRPQEEGDALRWRQVDYARRLMLVTDTEYAHLLRNPDSRGSYRLTEGRLAPDQEGPEPPLSWTAGGDLFELALDSRWGKEVAGKRGQLVISGPSGSVAVFVATFKWLCVPTVTDAHFLRAVYSFMRLPDGHSLYEVLRGAQIADPALFRGENRLQLFGDGPNSLGASQKLWDEVAAQARTNPAAANVIAQAQRPQ